MKQPEGKNIGVKGDAEVVMMFINLLENCLIDGKG